MLPLHAPMMACTFSRACIVPFTSALRAGRLSIEQRQRFEVDGLVTFELELRGKGARLERLDLVIPLRPEHSTLLNAVTDGTLHHQLGATPKGSGVVWDSRRVPRRP